jgi:hypothetical protein
MSQSFEAVSYIKKFQSAYRFLYFSMGQINCFHTEFWQNCLLLFVCFFYANLDIDEEPLIMIFSSNSSCIRSKGFMVIKSDKIFLA